MGNTHNFMKTTVHLWGDGLGLRRPVSFAREAKLVPGSEVALQFVSGRIVVTPIHPKKSYKLSSLLAKVSRKEMPTGNIWGAPVGREVW